MTLDEAIMHSLELVNKYELIAPDSGIVREYQQLADWLIELREFREEFTNTRQARRISELMKTAIADLSEQASCSTCPELKLFVIGLYAFTSAIVHGSQ